MTGILQILNLSASLFRLLASLYQIQASVTYIIFLKPFYLDLSNCAIDHYPESTHLSYNMEVGVVSRHAENVDITLPLCWEVQVYVGCADVMTKCRTQYRSIFRVTVFIKNLFVHL